MSEMISEGADRREDTWMGNFFRIHPTQSKFVIELLALAAITGTPTEAPEAALKRVAIGRFSPRRRFLTLISETWHTFGTSALSAERYHGSAEQDKLSIRVLSSSLEWFPKCTLSCRPTLRLNATRSNGPPPFKWSSLWEAPVVNPLNLKSYTIPIFNLNNRYSVSFHLSWLGFLVAFLSWFAFPPLIPEAIRSDLKLTTAQIGNSNIIALLATLLVRIAVGPLVDRFGPRKASYHVLGAIPSGLAGTATKASHLYAIRFFIGILGGTFVPCQAWTTAFFDKNVVGTANALVGGWGNMGGGITFVIMVSLFQQLVHSGLSQHIAWRVAFVAVPVPVLLSVAALTMIFGWDHPAGKWEDRHRLAAHTAVPGHGIIVKEVPEGQGSELNEKDSDNLDKEKNGGVNVQVQEVTDMANNIESELDVAVNEAVTFKTALAVVSNPLTWLPAIAYVTTFGFELAVDANLVNVLYGLYKSPTFGQLKAGYITAIYGLLNIFTRPLGGLIGDMVYRRWGVPGKKWWMLLCGFVEGALSIGLGLYIESHHKHGSTPDLATIIGIFVVMAIFNEAGCGANFALVPHCNPYSNGLMSGIVGSMGNLGGIIFALVFRFQPAPLGKAFWICGIIIMTLNASLAWIRVPAK
ncbi:Nitrate transporter [Ceratobasidium theobromae]|uniref:Nitrate transporter n=1 Tax=Ceratobasidium theobromae TaxID=1582974 RepID=A0A5N5QMY8_9AGAM|nr:Nitrate transporter [Ceratobasidium theobromae]